MKPITEASLMDIPSGTVLEVQVLKPHGGKVQVILVAPDGRYKVLFDWSLNAQNLINQNMKGEKLKPIPPNWPTDHDKPKPQVSLGQVKFKDAREHLTDEELASFGFTREDLKK